MCPISPAPAKGVDPPDRRGTVMALPDLCPGQEQPTPRTGLHSGRVGVKLAVNGMSIVKEKKRNS